MREAASPPRRLLPFFAAGALLWTAGLSFADVTPEAPLCEAAESENYITKASGQLLRGVANLSLCWVELFNQPVVARREGRNVIGGVFKGVGHTLLRGGKGVGELLLFLDPRAGETGSYPVISNDCSLGVIGLEER